MARTPKNELYREQQYDILLKILSLIGVTKDNTIIERDVIEREDNIKVINELQDDINKYFSTGTWKSVKIGVHTEINIIRNIFKSYNISILSIDKKRKNEDGIYKSYTLYKFEIPNEILEKI